MTFDELKTRVFRRLRESATSPVYFTETDVEDALNDGLIELADATEWNETWITIDKLNARPYYDLRTVIGDTFLTVGPAFNEDTSRWLIPSRVFDLDTHDARWETRVGESSRLLIRGLWWVRYWPLVNADSGTMKQYYTALPDRMADDEEEPGFPDTFHEGLVDFACYDLWSQIGETDLALQAWQSYLQTEAAVQAYVDGRLAGPHVPV